MWTILPLRSHQELNKHMKHVKHVPLTSGASSSRPFLPRPNHPHTSSPEPHRVLGHQQLLQRSLEAVALSEVPLLKGGSKGCQGHLPLGVVEKPTWDNPLEGDSHNRESVCIIMWCPIIFWDWAFNCIPRGPLFWLASFLGLPSTVLTPWRNYMRDFSRSFMIRGSLSTSSRSTVGLPEGCALSVLGMCLLDMMWHHYAAAFCPGIRIFSYVDNLGLTARDAGHLALGFATMQAFFTLWHMEIDLEKSYCWGVDAVARRALKAFPMRCVQHSNELGGSMTFHTQPRVVDLKARMARLEPRWPILARSAASLYQKLVALTVSFWPEGLHGSLACRFALRHLDRLRRRAAAALGWKLAGSSPSMRFLLCPLPFADPLLWHHKTVLQGFRRLCQASADFVAQWRLFLQNYDGSLHVGPYSKMLDLFSHLGWHW